MKYLILLAVLAHFLLLTNQYEILAEIPLKFQLAGNVSYTPTSGGVNIQGYILKVGFSRFSWVGIKFMTLTSRSTYDILVIQRQDVPVGGYYKTTIKDYFVSSARQDKLLSDSNNNMDKQSITYTDSNYFETEVYRTKGNTQGQDWQGGEFVHICFYTSANAFNQNVWTGLSESCYGYDISADYFSTFRGKYIGYMAVDGVSSAVYGGIQGPLLRLQLFWYCLKPTLSSANVFFRISDKISEQLGYDYHKCGVGDFFGANVDSLTADSLWSGYNDGVCTMTSSTLSTKIAYSRKVYTNDQYDSKIYNTTEICVRVGFSQACSVLNLQILFPVMTVESALIVWQSSLFYSLSLIFATLVTLLSQK